MRCLCENRTHVIWQDKGCLYRQDKLTGAVERMVIKENIWYPYATNDAIVDLKNPPK